MAQGDVNRELVNKFRSMTLDRLERMTLALLELERNPDDADHARELLRECHTLKGEARMMGFVDIQLVAHRLEDLMKWAEARSFRVPPDVNDALLTGFDMIGMLVQKRPGDQDVIDLPEYLDAVDAILRTNREEGAGESGDASASAPAATGESETTSTPAPPDTPAAGATGSAAEATDDEAAPTASDRPAPASAERDQSAVGDSSPRTADTAGESGDATTTPPAADEAAPTPAPTPGPPPRPGSEPDASRSAVTHETPADYDDPNESSVAVDLSAVTDSLDRAARRTATGKLPPGSETEWMTPDEAQHSTTVRVRRDGSKRYTGTRMTHRSDENSIRINLDKLDNLLTLTGDLLLSHERTTQRTELAHGLRDDMRQFLRDLNELNRQLPELNDDLFSGNVSIGQSGWTEAAVASSARVVNEAARSMMASLEKLLRDLKDDSFRNRNQLETLEISVRELRLLPVGTLFRRYPRAIRDLAREQGKRVNVRLQGEGVELDKRILDQISEPLLHLIRNSVDHGIEMPDVREAAAKPVEATLRLSARHIGALVEIEVGDDGRGIDPERIRAAAVERKVVNLEEAGMMSPGELLELIFEPGFSTRREITDVSGRGVGLDVVRETVEQLGGTVQVVSQLGTGSRFVMQVPVRVAISKAQIVRLGQDRYAFPSEEIEKLVRLPRNELVPVGNGIALRYRMISGTGARGELAAHEELVPVDDLARLLRLPASEEADPLSLVVIQHGGRRHALQVEECLGEQEIVRRPFDRFLEGLTILSGTTVLPDGGIVPILNIVEIMRQTGEVLRVREGSVHGDDDGEDDGAGRGRRILLVEDSEITRELLVEILRQQGFRVTEARTGVEALDALRLEVPDLIVTDIDMPEMDGFTLLEQLRGQPEFYNLPVVVLTTRGDNEDKRRALDLGANAYLVKTDFQEDNLVGTVERLLGRA